MISKFLFFWVIFYQNHEQILNWKIIKKLFIIFIFVLFLFDFVNFLKELSYIIFSSDCAVKIDNDPFNNVNYFWTRLSNFLETFY